MYGKDKKDSDMMRTLKEADNPMRLIRDEGRKKKVEPKRTMRRGRKWTRRNALIPCGMLTVVSSQQCLRLPVSRPRMSWSLGEQIKQKVADEEWGRGFYSDEDEGE
jgi:hypothetical protein